MAKKIDTKLKQKLLELQDNDREDEFVDAKSEDKIRIIFCTKCFVEIGSQTQRDDKKSLCKRWVYNHLTWREVEYRVKEGLQLIWVDGNVDWLFKIVKVNIDTNTVYLESLGKND
jgi:hypothetical protein